MSGPGSCDRSAANRLLAASLTAIAFSLLPATMLHAQSRSKIPAGYDRGGQMNAQSRSVTVAKNGIVATSHPLASLAGLDVLRAGGNAADAAIAASATIAVVEPMSCGIGGDLFVIYWDARTQKLYGLNASGRSPYKLNRQVFAEKGLAKAKETRNGDLEGHCRELLEAAKRA